MSQNHPNRGSSPSTPRWVKIFVIIIIVLVVLVIILHVMGFGFGSHRTNETSNTWVGNVVNYTPLSSTSIDYPLQFIVTHNLQCIG